MKIKYLILIIIFLSALTATYFYLSRTFKNIPENVEPGNSIVKDETPPDRTLKEYTIEKLGLTFSAPSDMVFSDESDDQSIRFTVQRGVYPDPDYYQLYATLQYTGNMTNDAEGIKSQLLDGSKDIIVGGYEAVQGQYKGERNRYMTFIFTDKGILNLATAQPTVENERTTNSILSTFVFKRDSVVPSTHPTTEKAIQAALAKKYSKPLDEVTVKVNKEVPGFASGSVTFGQGGIGEGGMWIAVLGNGWEVVWDGNGNVDCNKMRQEFGVPDTILKPNFCE